MADLAASSGQRYISLGVQCVATGVRHDAREVCYVALVDYDENILLEKKIKPDSPIVSYLTPLTGIRDGDLDRAESIQEVITQVKSLLGPDVTLVGHALTRAIKWLKLEEGKDYGSVKEFSTLFRRYNSRYANYTTYSLHHEIDTLLPKGKKRLLNSYNYISIVINACI